MSTWQDCMKILWREGGIFLDPDAPPTSPQIVGNPFDVGYLQCRGQVMRSLIRGVTKYWATRSSGLSIVSLDAEESLTIRKRKWKEISGMYQGNESVSQAGLPVCDTGPRWPFAGQEYIYARWSSAGRKALQTHTKNLGNVGRSLIETPGRKGEGTETGQKRGKCEGLAARQDLA